MPRAALTPILLLTATLALAGCDVEAVGPREHQKVSETRRLDAQGTFTLENTNGTVTVDTWNEASVRIEADKVATPSALEHIRIDIRGEGPRVDVATMLPRTGWWGRSGQVDYRVTVPHGARVEVETTNGAVRVHRTGGVLRASTTNGSVEIDQAAGQVEASTTNGAIKADFRQAPSSGWNRFSTTNGSISVALPADASGQFEASTVNGGIHTDFPLEVGGRVGGRRLRGRLGQGGARFEMRTVNGGVRIRKRDGA